MKEGKETTHSTSRREGHEGERDDILKVEGSRRRKGRQILQGEERVKQRKGTMTCTKTAKGQDKGKKKWLSRLKTQ